jgi:hypothetical protein
MKPSLAAVLAGFGQQYRFDANETAFLERQLTAVRTKVFEVVYPDLKARSFVPIATDIPASADTYAFPVLDRVGEAKIISKSGKDIPRVDVNVREVTGKVYTIGDAYGWNVYELREAARVNVPLTEWKARVARDAIERQIDQLLAFGYTDSQQSGLHISGLINNAAVEAAGITDLDNWVQGTTTGQAMVDEMMAFTNAIVIGSSEKFIPDTLAMPTTRYNIFATTRLADSDMTALRWFLQNSPYIKNVAQWHKLDGAGAGGLDRAIAYKRDPSVLEGVIPQEFEQFPPQQDGLDLVINCTARGGGVKIYQPSAVAYGDFASS